jgi:hypothetical protein
MMELFLSADVFQCDDGIGNGCGRLFDGFTVKRIGQLCEYCAADLPDNEGC